MKQINGKNYYISIGCVEDNTKAIDIKEIQSIYINSKKGTISYIDDTDKDNIITLPLIRVHDIQKINGKYRLKVLVHPSKMEYGNQTTLRSNIVGLFEEYVKDDIQYIRHIAFYTTDVQYYKVNDSAITFYFELEESKLKEIVEDEK